LRLEVENCGQTELTGFDCFFGPPPPKIEQSQAVAELKKYAAKQKPRVG
jgi:hypothetical protein